MFVCVVMCRYVSMDVHVYVLCSKCGCACVYMYAYMYWACVYM